MKDSKSPKCLSAGKWLDKSWFIDTKENSAALKRKERREKRKEKKEVWTNREWSLSENSKMQN